MAAGKTILIIEDDSQTRGLLKTALATGNYRVLEADGAQVGLHLFRKDRPDLVVLDINLPDGNGLEVCSKIREHKGLATTPVIMLTGQSGLESKASGFKAGADQYLVKPVHPQEFLLWVEALLRRLGYEKDEPEVLEVGELRVDHKAHLVHFKDQTISDLTGKEFDLLYFLARKTPQVLSRKYILSVLWRTITVDRVVDTHISNLRRKLPTELADKIQNVPGKGFRFFS